MPNGEGVKVSAVGFFGVLLSCLVIVGCVRPSTRRAYEQHMLQAEAYKADFDRQVPRGTTLRAVKEFLQTQDRHILNEVPDWGTGEATGEGLLELFQGKSIRWYCGQGSVGLSLSFLQGKLVSTSVTSWSFDCP
jgi:hypothetical protein